VTQPDRPYGRKHELRATPVKERAAKLGIPVLACEDVSSPEAVQAVLKEAPDYIVVAAFGQKLPAALLEAPKKACLNVHPSLLPLYRGSNPIQRAIMNGEKVTGVSIMHMSERMDAGDIALQKTVEIGPDETFGTLESRLASLGAHALVEAISLIEAGSGGRTAQDESKATRAPRLRPGEDVIEWDRPSQEVHNLVRALSPQPGAVTWYGDERIKVWETRLLPGRNVSGCRCGSIVGLEESMAIVATGDGAIGILEVQPDGKKVMSASAFLAGRRRDGIFGRA